MSIHDDEGADLRRAVVHDLDSIPVGPRSVAGLLSDLDGINHLPLAEQAARLETARKGLDDVLARPVTGTSATGHG